MLHAKFNRFLLAVAAICLVGVASPSQSVQAEEFAVSGGKLKMTAPESWEKQRPRINMIEAEFQVPLEDGDEGKVRVTWMQVGGGVDPNITRWEGQFYGAEAQSKEMEVDSHKVYLVELSGSYKDTGGRPFGDATERKDYAMVAAIIEMDSGPEYYIKMVGPGKTVKANKEAFTKMVEGMKFE